MKTLLKITIFAGAAACVASIPVFAGNQTAALRGQFAPQSAIADFEGRYIKPQRTHSVPNYNTTRHASSTYSQQGYVSPQQGNVRYYNANDYYGQSGTKVKKRKKSKRHLRSGDVYDFESGPCRNTCRTHAPQLRTHVPQPTYNCAATTQPFRQQITGYKCWDGQIVSDFNGCRTQTITRQIPQYRCWDGEIVTDINGCKDQTVTREVSRQVLVSTPTHTTTSTPAWSGNVTSIPTNCPSGTTAQTDGTCMEVNSTPITSFSETTTTGYYDTGSSSISSSSSGFSTSIPTNCPSGTTAQSDGTCLESNSTPFTSYSDTSSSSYSDTSSSSYYDIGSSSDSFGSSTSYDTGSSFGTTIPTNCPSGTTAQSDGTCLEGSSSSTYTNPYEGSAVELFPTSPTRTPTYGYVSDGFSTGYPALRK